MSKIYINPARTPTYAVYAKCLGFPCVASCRIGVPTPLRVIHLTSDASIQGILQLPGADVLLTPSTIVSKCLRLPQQPERVVHQYHHRVYTAPIIFKGSLTDLLVEDSVALVHTVGGARFGPRGARKRVQCRAHIVFSSGRSQDVNSGRGGSHGTFKVL